MTVPIRVAAMSIAVAACFSVAPLHAVEPAGVLALSKKHTPEPPWLRTKVAVRSSEVTTTR